MAECDDLDLRVHHRSQMEAAGVRKIFDRLTEFESIQINRQLKNWETLASEDNQRLLELYDQEVLKNVRDPDEVFQAIEKRVAGTKANDYFLSAMRHLLLIRGEEDEQARYYQLVDALIASIVLDRNPNFAGGLSSITGVSVARLFAQMGDQEHARQVEEDAKGLRTRVVELEFERDNMRERLDQSADGLVGDLQAKIKSLEEKLRLSRHNTDALKGQLNEKERGFNEQTQQLEVQITELFKMLREARGFESLVTATEQASSGGMARKDLVVTLAKQMERQKTIGILEGAHRKKKPVNGDSPPAGEDDLGRTSRRQTSKKSGLRSALSALDLAEEDGLEDNEQAEVLPNEVCY